jgi:biopolymer transport protein ExbD
MAIRSRKKALTEVNLSSMTDIIFMLLIFFMLTSTLIKIVPFDLPESFSRAKAPIKITVEIRAGDLGYEVNDNPATEEELKDVIAEAIAVKKAAKEDVTVTIIAEKGVQFRKVTDVIKIANSLGTKAILATEPHT